MIETIGVGIIAVLIFIGSVFGAARQGKRKGKIEGREEVYREVSKKEQELQVNHEQTKAKSSDISIDSKREWMRNNSRDSE